MQLRERIIAARDPDATVISVCSGPGCLAYKSEVVADQLVAALALALSPVAALSQVKLSCNWMAAAGHPGEDAPQRGGPQPV